MSRDVAAKELAHAVGLAEAMPKFCAKRQAGEVVFVMQSRKREANALVGALTEATGPACAAVIAVAAASVAVAALASAGMSEEQARLTLIELIR